MDSSMSEISANSGDKESGKLKRLNCDKILNNIDNQFKNHELE